MLDIHQTFSPNIFLPEQMFDPLATSANKASSSGKSNQSETQSVRRRRKIAAGLNIHIQGE